VRARGAGVAALALAATVGCGGGTQTVKHADLGPPVDERTAEKDAKGTVQEIYGSISHGKPDNLFSVVDERVVVFGPRKTDGFANRSDALVALNKVIEADATRAVKSGRLDVVVSPGGHSAWAYDVVNVDGTPLAVVAILSSEDDFFRVVAADMARTPSRGALRDEQRKIAVVPTGAPPHATVEGGADGAIDRFRAGLLDPQLWGDDLASRRDALVIGPARGEVARGKKEIKKLWQKRVDADTRAALTGDVSAHVTADGKLAWVTAPVTRVAKDEEPLPLREFAVFEQADDGWKLIALHEAVALDAPGAGAELVKILPPEREAAPPPKADEPKVDAKPKAKKKKHKKRKRSDDE
jgi:ketosteroid isomerase-like protein